MDFLCIPFGFPYGSPIYTYRKALQEVLGLSNEEETRIAKQAELPFEAGGHDLAPIAPHAPLAHLASQLHDLQALPARWRTLSATPTYNPLGRTLTFTSPEDIGTALAVLSEEVNGPDDESSE